MEDIYIVSGARTAIGTFGGSLSGFEPGELSATIFKEAIGRAGIAPTDVENVVMGTVVPTQAKDVYLSRIAAVNAGIPIETPAMNVDRLCGSGLQSVVSAAQAIALGEHDIALAAGCEIMSRAPHMTHKVRTGVKMGNVVFEDAMIGALQDPFHDYHMGVTAENVASRCQVTRESQDALAVESHRRAAAAIDAGYFKDQIVPIEVKTRKGVTVFDTDEHVRRDASLESMAALKPVFQKDGSVTAGNSSGINDGAAAVVLASGKAVAEKGLKPLAKIIGWGHAGVEPEVMGLGPVRAVPMALKRAGLTLDQIDVIEANEAFAAQACAVTKELGLDPAKTNPNGSGISLGHPIGATGTILTVKTIYELQRTGKRYGLITMCIGGGQGIAVVVERV
jgi:acetyl-CoA C-acetyltransferase